MPTPIGHSIFALSVYQGITGRPVGKNDIPGILVFVSLANLPDIDFAPILTMGFKAVGMYHQAYTHNFGFCLGSSLFVSLLYYLYRRKQFWRNFLLFFLLVFSHIVLDSMGNDTRYPFGVQLFWPIIDTHFMFPVSIFLGAAKSSVSEMFSLWNLFAVVMELVIFVPMFFLVYWKISSKTDNNTASG